jgi:hypothetical protein
MVGSTTGAPMSPEHGGYQATAAKYYYTTSPPYYTTTSRYATSTNYAEAPKCYSTKAQDLRYKLRFPELHHQGSWVLHYWCSRVLHNRVICPSLLHRGSNLFQYHSGRVLHRTAQVLICLELHKHNWCGEVLRSPGLQHRSCSIMLRWTEILYQGCFKFTTLRNPSITLLQATIKLRLLLTTLRSPGITIQPNGKW